jgi:hypothetical protein
MRTYDNRGNLLGDDPASVLQSGAAPVSIVTPAVPAPSPFALLLKPPLVYFLAIGIGIAAYIYERNQRT